MANNILLDIQINNGFPFKALIDYLKSVNTEGTFIFKKNQIILNEFNCANPDSSTILNNVILRRQDIGRKYVFNENLIDGPYEEKSFNACLNLTEFHIIIKNIKKGSSLRLFTEKDSEYLNVERIKNSSKDDNVGFGTIRVSQPESLSIHEIDGYNEEEPSCVVPVDEFVDACATVTAPNSIYVDITFYQSGLVLRGVFAEDSIGQMCTVGSPFQAKTKKTGNIKYVIHDEPLFQIEVSKKDLKSLIKAKNFCPDGNVKIYIVEGNPPKFVFDIGTYGVLEHYMIGREGLHKYK